MFGIKPNIYIYKKMSDFVDEADLTHDWYHIEEGMGSVLFSWDARINRTIGDDESSGGESLLHPHAILRIRPGAGPPVFKTPTFPLTLNNKKEKRVAFQYPTRMPVWCKAHASDCNLTGIHFVVSSTFLGFLAGSSRKADTALILHRVNGTIFTDTLRMNDKRDMNHFGYRVEQACTKGGAGGKWDENQSYHAHVVQIGTHRVLIVAEVDAVLPGDGGGLVEIKSGNSQHVNEAAVLLQCVANGSSVYTRFESEGFSNRRVLLGLQLRQVTEERLRSCIELRKYGRRILQWLDEISVRCVDEDCIIQMLPCPSDGFVFHPSKVCLVPDHCRERGWWR